MGEANQGLKVTLYGKGGGYSQALTANYQSLACLKWVTVAAAPEHERPSLICTILLSDTQNGELHAGARRELDNYASHGGDDAIAAKALAKPNAQRIGFVGCGHQAVSHLMVLRAVLPSIERVTCFSRTQSSALRLRDRAVGLGLEACTVTNAREAVERQDIVVSSVPARDLKESFLDARWLEQGTLASLADMGRSWIGSRLDAFQIVATDSRAQSTSLVRDGKIAYEGPFSYELADLLELTLSESDSLSARKAFLFGGMGICDAAIALRCYETACKERKGNLARVTRLHRSTALGAGGIGRARHIRAGFAFAVSEIKPVKLRGWSCVRSG